MKALVWSSSYSSLTAIWVGERHEKRMEPNFRHVFNSMAIDEYFGHSLGELPYRSLRFHSFDLPLPRLQPFPIVNFTHDGWKVWHFNPLIFFNV